MDINENDIEIENPTPKKQDDNKTKTILIIIGIFLFLALISAIVNGNSSDKQNYDNSDKTSTSDYKYHQDNIDVITNAISTDIAEKIVLALEKTSSIGKYYKIAADDVIKYENNEYEIYIEIMVRVLVDNDKFTIYTYESQYDLDTALLLYDSTKETSLKTLSTEERDNIRQSQRKYIVENIIQITPSTGVLLHNSLGKTQLSFTIKNVGRDKIDNISLKITPGFLGYQSDINSGTYTTHESILAGRSKEYNLSPKGWTDYDIFTITEVIIYFDDGTSIKLDEYDCQFL